ncbi:hypothetical protein [Sphingomonas jaspsi]|uniref:hypothetical protein n=1 Tax=Sphingomonas jaspsi TaxID=392409 RepID=UPI0012EBCF1F|nr:hypothetical protein [Sphingomonas jaspsi]
MKLAPFAFVLLLATACQKPTEMQEPSVKPTESMAGQPDGVESDGEWKLTQIVDRLTDERGVETNGVLNGAKVSVSCMSGKSLEYVFDLSDRTDDVGVFGRSAAVQIRLDEASPEQATIQTDRRFPNQVRITAKDVGRDLDWLADTRALNMTAGEGSLLAVRMALANRVRLAIRTASGDAFIDLQQSGAIKDVLGQCSATSDELQMRIEAKSAEMAKAVAFKQQSEELRAELADCLTSSGLGGSGATPQVGFDVRSEGPANVNSDFGDNEQIGIRIRQCWPTNVPSGLIGHRVTIRLPN